MAENLQRNRGRPSNYKFDRGGAPTEMGPYIGIVKNNIDYPPEQTFDQWKAWLGVQ